MLGKELIPIDWMNAYSGSPMVIQPECLMLRSPYAPDELSILEQDEITHMKQVIHDAI